MTRIHTVLGLLSAFLVSLWFQPQASAGPFPLTVKVGYADNSHCPVYNPITDPCVALFGPGGLDSANFPNPWASDVGSLFFGAGAGGAAFDAGALLLTNNSGSDVAVGGVAVMIGAVSFNLWPSFTIPNGMSAILTQTMFDPTKLTTNFDTSDFAGFNGGISNGVIPQIFITIGGQTTTLMDTNQILNTGGFDEGCTPPPVQIPPLPTCVLTNESHPWSLITGQTATPEPASILLLGSGLLSLGTFVRRKMRA